MRIFETKAYGSPGGGNPLFPKPENPRKFWIPFILVVGLSLGLGGLGVLVYGPYLRLEDVQVDGTVTLSPEDMVAKLHTELAVNNFLLIPNDHRWFYRANKAEVMLRESFPLKSVVTVKQGGRLSIAVVEDIFMVAYRSTDEVYLLDQSGKVLRLAEPVEKAAVLLKVGAVTEVAGGLGEEDEEGVEVRLHADMPVIRDKQSYQPELGEQIYNHQKIANIISFSQGLRDMEIVPVEFVSDDIALPWFAVTSDQDYLILFDANEDVDTQLAVLQAVLVEYFATQDLPRYIDIRFGKRVYVR